MSRGDGPAGRIWAAIAVATVLLACALDGARAQDMEPRAYSAAPVDLNFLLASYLRTTGSVSIDPSVPITGAKASINTWSLGYDRTFDLFGHTASAAIVIPYFDADLSGQVFGTATEINRSGLGDIRLRLTGNLIGNPAQTPAQFATRQPTTSVGTSLVIIAPTGDYNPAHLANISSHRWAFRPEIGVSQPLGDWFADAAAGVWLFTDNNDFFMGHVRSEAPLLEAQAHVGYYFRPGLWLAADGSYFSGGDTSLSGVPGRDAQTATRYGLTLSLPVRDGISAKLTWATWLSSHNGGNYNTIGVSLQYRWFDP